MNQSMICGTPEMFFSCNSSIGVYYEPYELIFQESQETQLDEFCTKSIKVYNGSYQDQHVYVYKVEQ